MTTMTLPHGEPLALTPDGPPSRLLMAPVTASLRIDGVEYCTKADVDWNVADGGDREFEPPDAGTGSFTLWGLNGDRFDALDVGQTVVFELRHGSTILRICTHRVSEVTRRLAWRELGGRRNLVVEVTVLTAGPLERFGRTKISYTKGDTWLAEKDDVRARRLMTKVAEGMKSQPFPDYFDPALLVVADPYLYDTGASGGLRHWTDETVDATNSWVVRGIRAERTFPAGGSGSLLSLRPHMSNGLGVQYQVRVSGTATVRPVLFYATTADAALTTTTKLSGTAVVVNGTNVAVDGTFPSLPSTSHSWVRFGLEITAASGVVGIEYAKASTDAIALPRVTLKNLPDADVERQSASELFSHLAENAHAAFFESRSGRVAYMSFGRLKPKLGGWAHPIHAILECNEVLADVTSSTQNADRINRILVGYGDGKTLTREDAADIAVHGLYEESAGGELNDAASADIIADDFLPGSGSTGKAHAPRERITSMTTVPFDLLPPQVTKALVEMPPLACVRVDNTPRGFPASALGSWVGAVLGTEIKGGAHRRLPGGNHSVRAEMTLRVLDMTVVSDRPAATVTTSAAAVIEGMPVTLAYTVPSGEIPPGSSIAWQYRRTADTAWRTYSPPGSSISWTWTTAIVDTIRWRVEIVTPDGLVWDSNDVSVEVKANLRATSATLTAADGTMMGGTV